MGDIRFAPEEMETVPTGAAEQYMAFDTFFETLKHADNPLEQAINDAFTINRVAVEDHKRGDPYLSPIFVFCRELKAYPELRHLPADAALLKVEAAMNGVEIGFTHFEGIHTDEDGRVAFLRNWDEIRCVPGEEPLETALVNAQRWPVEISPYNRTKGYEKFISLAANLQGFVGWGMPILLPCANVGKLLGCSKVTVTTYRKWAVEDGFLTVTNEHTFDKKTGKGRATEFVFDSKRFVLKKAH